MERLEPAAGFHTSSVISLPPSFQFACGMAILAMLIHGRDARATIALPGERARVYSCRKRLKKCVGFSR